MSERQRLNEAMRAWSNTLSQEDVEGDPWDIAHKAFIAARDFARSEAAAENARLRTALAWYAGPEAYDRGPNPIPWRMPVQDDQGKRARAALAAAGTSAAGAEGE